MSVPLGLSKLFVLSALRPVSLATLTVFGMMAARGMAQQSVPTGRPQSQLATGIPARSATSVQAYDPTRPEAQPDLSLDHDPILSPDPEDNSAINPAAPVPNERAGALKKGQNGVYTLHQDVDEVLLNCTVIDENGKPVLDLKQEDFRVWEDGTPQATTSFQHQDLPVSLGIVVDNSGSMRDKRSAVNS